MSWSGASCPSIAPTRSTEPRYRYQAGAALVAALEQALRGAQPELPPPSPAVIARPAARQLAQRQAQVAVAPQPPAQVPRVAAPGAYAPPPPPSPSVQPSPSGAGDRDQPGQGPDQGSARPAAAGGSPPPAHSAARHAATARATTSLSQQLRRAPRPALLGLGVLALLLAFLVLRGNAAEQGGSTPGGGAGATSWVLRIVKHGDEYATITNISEDPFPLGPLQLGEKRQALQGTAWDVPLLGPAACVVAQRTKNRPAAEPATSCANPSAALELPNEQRFWTSTFNVYYDGTILATCVKDQDRCQFAITVEPE
jgi:hypothetical protein